MTRGSPISQQKAGLIPAEDSVTPLYCEQLTQAGRQAQATPEHSVTTPTHRFQMFPGRKTKQNTPFPNPS